MPLQAKAEQKLGRGKEERYPDLRRSLALPTP